MLNRIDYLISTVTWYKLETGLYDVFFLSTHLLRKNNGLENS
jgi:hypothetical protein